jgi:hypothetical protein
MYGKELSGIRKIGVKLPVERTATYKNLELFVINSVLAVPGNPLDVYRTEERDECIKDFVQVENQRLNTLGRVLDRAFSHLLHPFILSHSFISFLSWPTHPLLHYNHPSLIYNQLEPSCMSLVQVHCPALKLANIIEVTSMIPFTVCKPYFSIRELYYANRY